MVRENALLFIIDLRFTKVTTLYHNKEVKNVKIMTMIQGDGERNTVQSLEEGFSSTGSSATILQ
jgi:hypothetical protein